MSVGLLQACDDPKLFGLKLHPAQRELLEGLERTPNAIWACGRRGGKTLLASVVCVYDCLFRPDLDALVRPGELRLSVAVATNVEQARVLIRQARLLIDGSPLLRRMLASETSDELMFDLGGNVRTGLRAFPCSSRGLRGYAVSTAVMDEAAFFVSTDDGNAAANQVFRALQPATAQFGAAGRMLIVSSPMGSSGFFADRWQRADAGELEGWEARQVATAEMNPAVSADYLAQVERDEPDTFGSEYLALFESGGHQFFDMSRFVAAEGLAVGMPGDAVSWTAGLDPAVTSDGFGIALLGRHQGGATVAGPILAVEPERKRGWTFERKRSATDRVMETVASLCREYRATVYTDQHESVAVTTRLRQKGLAAFVVGMTRETKYRAFAELRDRLYDGSLVLPDNAALFDELSRVQSKIVDGSPYPKIILPRSARGHCDQVQALALCIFQMRSPEQLGYRAPQRVATLLNDPRSSEQWAQGVDRRPGPGGNEPAAGDGAGYTSRQLRRPWADDFNIMTDPF